MSFGLSYKGKPVTLLPGTSINWEIQDDLFDFDNIGQGYSWPITIPREGNEHIFFFAGDPDNPDQLLKTWDGFAITFSGNVWWQVSFELTESDGYYYQGNLTSINSKFFENKDKSIRELITATFDNTATETNTMGKVNALAESNYRFPLMHLFGLKFQTNLDDIFTFPALPLANDLDYYCIPVFSFIYIVEQALAGVGFTFEDHFSEYDSNGVNNLRNLLLVNNRVIDTWSAVHDVSKYIPDMTLTDLLNDLAIVSGASVMIPDYGDNVLQLRSMARDVNRSAEKIAADPNVKVTKSDVVNLKLSFDLSNDDLLKDNTVDKLEGTYRGEFDTSTDWDVLPGPVLDDYGFIRSLNAYYRVTKPGDSLISEFYSLPFQEYQTGEENVKERKLKLLPCAKDRYSYETITDRLNIENSSGKVKIIGFSNVPLISQDIFFQATYKGQKVGTTGYISIDSVGSDFVVINKTYTVEARVDELIVRTDENYFFPVISGEPHWPEGGQKNEGFTGRLILWHGMQDTIDDVSTYAYASSDPYFDDGSTLGSLSLSFTAPEHNIVDKVWQPIINLLSSARIIKLKTHLSPKAITDLVRQKVGSYVNQRFRFKRFRGKMSDRGMEDQEIEGWGL
jgi:hypothetical protein